MTVGVCVLLSPRRSMLLHFFAELVKHFLLSFSLYPFEFDLKPPEIGKRGRPLFDARPSRLRLVSNVSWNAHNCARLCFFSQTAKLSSWFFRASKKPSFMPLCCIGSTRPSSFGHIYEVEESSLTLHFTVRVTNRHWEDLAGLVRLTAQVPRFEGTLKALI